MLDIFNNIKNFESFEKSRNDLMNKLNKSKDELLIYEEDIHIADEIEGYFEEFELISKIQNIDQISFLEISVTPKDNILFGEISKVIEDAINLEIDSLYNVNENNAAVNATPEILRDSYILKKRELVEDLILESNTDNYQNNLISIRCIELYSEMSQDISSISERTKKKNKQNEELLVFIGSTPKVNENLPESNLAEVISFTVAISSNLKDGSYPDINRYKERVVDSLNKAINSSGNVANIDSVIKTFSDVSSILETYKDEIKSLKNSNEYSFNLEAIKSACEKGSVEIEKLYDKGLEM